MNITNRNRHVAVLVACATFLGLALWSYGNEAVQSSTSVSSFFNDQVVVFRIQFESSKRSDILTEDVRISYLKNMISMLNSLEVVMGDGDIKKLRMVISAPNSVTDLEVQKKIFAISKCIRTLLNEISTPFGDPINIENLGNATKTKIIEERLNELKGYGV